MGLEPGLNGGSQPCGADNPDVCGDDDDFFSISTGLKAVGAGLYAAWYYTSPASCFYVKAVANNPVGVGVPISAGVLVLVPHPHTWCETNGVHFVFGLARNKRLRAL